MKKKFASSEGDKNRGDKESSPTSPKVSKTPPGDENQVPSSEGDENRTDKTELPYLTKSYENSTW